MRRLDPCIRCRRHVESTAATCPFCAEPLVATARRSHIGALSRAAIFAGAAACAHPHPQAAPAPLSDPWNQPAPPTPPAHSDDGNSLSGRVRFTNGDPIPFAELELSSLDDARAPRHAIKTDTDGRFTVRGLAPGRYQLRLEGRRHMNAEEYVDLTIKPGANSQDIVEPDRAPSHNAIPAPYGAPPARRRTV